MAVGRETAMLPKILLPVVLGDGVLLGSHRFQTIAIRCALYVVVVIFLDPLKRCPKTIEGDNRMLYVVGLEAVEFDVVRLIVEQCLHDVQYLLFICGLGDPTSPHFVQ